MNKKPIVTGEDGRKLLEWKLVAPNDNPVRVLVNIIIQTSNATEKFYIRYRARLPKPYNVYIERDDLNTLWDAVHEVLIGEADLHWQPALLVAIGGHYGIGDRNKFVDDIAPIDAVLEPDEVARISCGLGLSVLGIQIAQSADGSRRWRRPEDTDCQQFGKAGWPSTGKVATFGERDTQLKPGQNYEIRSIIADTPENRLQLVEIAREIRKIRENYDANLSPETIEASLRNLTEIKRSPQ